MEATSSCRLQLCGLQQQRALQPRASQPRALQHINCSCQLTRAAARPSPHAQSVGRLSGSVCVNGTPRGPSFARHVSYVPQEDTFLPTMTVAETCRLHAALTLPRGTPRAQMGQRTDEVLAAMGMLHARDTLASTFHTKQTQSTPAAACFTVLLFEQPATLSLCIG